VFRQQWVTEALDEPPGRHDSLVIGAFQDALHAVMHAKGLKDGLQRAMAIGSDTDTVAAIAGALKGVARRERSSDRVRLRKLHPGLEKRWPKQLEGEGSGRSYRRRHARGPDQENWTLSQDILRS
jgi:ADP-ribosylglycohydrolase